jgi:hypothetical protein
MDSDGKTPLWYTMEHEYTSIANLINESKKKDLEC